MEPIPVRTRERIIALYEEGKQTSEISERTGYCPAAVRRVKQRLRERGTLEPLAGTPGPKGKLTDEVKGAAARAGGVEAGRDPGGAAGRAGGGGKGRRLDVHRRPLARQARAVV